MADADEDDDDDDVVAAVAAIALTASETYVFSAIASSTHAMHGINSIDLTNKSFAEEQLLQRLRGLSICHFFFFSTKHSHTCSSSFDTTYINNFHATADSFIRKLNVNTRN